MSKIIKFCPRCGYETDNEQDNFCPVCVDLDEPIRLVEKTVDAEPSQQASVASAHIPSADKVLSKVTSSTETHDISLGRANAIAGDVKVETHSTVGDITVINEKKTRAEEITDKKRLYRSECKKYCVDGFISDAGKAKLDDLRAELDLDKDIANDILNEVKLLSKKVRTELPPAGRIKLEYAVNAVERNDERAITSAIVDLESWMERVQVDELNQMYYQLYAIVYPGKYLDLLKKDTREDYWKTFWSYVAYGIQGLQGEAETALAELTAWDSFYPTQNQSLLSVVGYLMRDEENAARSAFGSLTPGYSKELAPVYNTLHELLETDWSNVSSRLSPRSKFYAHTLFGDFTKGIQQKQKEAETVKVNAEAKRLEEEARIKAEAEKLQYQKESFILAYSESNGNADKACQNVGITNATFNSWLSEDRAFSDSFNDAQRRLEAKREEEQRSIEEQRERDAQNNRLKNEFVQLYSANDCDLLKTCAETGIDSATFRDWNETDPVFADKVKYIKRVHEEELREEQVRIRRIKIKKALPVIIILLLLGLIGYTVISRINAAKEAEIVRQAEIAEQQKLQSQHEDLLKLFENAISEVKLDENGADALERVESILADIKSFESEHKDLTAPQYSAYKQKVLDLCDSLIQYYTQKMTSTEIDPTRNFKEFEANRLLLEKVELLKKRI